MVEQQGTDVAVTLFPPHGERLQEADGWAENRGAEQRCWWRSTRPAIIGSRSATSSSARPGFPRPAGRAACGHSGRAPAGRRVRKFSGRRRRAEAQRQPRRAQQVFAELGEKGLAAEVLLSSAVRNQDDDAAASELYRAAAAAFAPLPGGGPLKAVCRVSYGGSLLNLGRAEEATAVLTTGLAAARRERMVFNEARALLGALPGELRLGDLQELSTTARGAPFVAA